LYSHFSFNDLYVLQRLKIPNAGFYSYMCMFRCLSSKVQRQRIIVACQLQLFEYYLWTTRDRIKHKFGGRGRSRTHQAPKWHLTGFEDQAPHRGRRSSKCYDTLNTLSGSPLSITIRRSPSLRVKPIWSKYSNN
jgi:hypothetical protein